MKDEFEEIIEIPYEGYSIDRFPDKKTLENFLNKIQPDIRDWEIYEVAAKISFQIVTHNEELGDKKE